MFQNKILQKIDTTIYYTAFFTYKKNRVYILRQAQDNGIVLFILLHI